MPVMKFPVSGLWTSFNPWADSPEGSLASADNVVFYAPRVLGPRRGFERLSGTFGWGGSAADGVQGARANSLAFYNDVAFVHYTQYTGTVPFVAFHLQNRLAWRHINSSSNYGGSSADYDPAGNRVRFVQASRDLFFNCDDGVYMVSFDPSTEGYDGTVVEAGNQQGLELTGYPTSDSSWMPANSAMAYRYTVCSVDAFNRVIEGAPSGRCVVQNYVLVPAGRLTRNDNFITASLLAPLGHYFGYGDVVYTAGGTAGITVAAGNKTVWSAPDNQTFVFVDSGSNGTATFDSTFEISRGTNLQVYLPAGLEERNFLRIYRSDAATVTSGALAEPSDDLYLCYETPFLTSGNLATGLYQFVDTTPETMLGVPLHTNPNTGDGADQGNFQPPVCEDHEFFASRNWYANTVHRQRLDFQLLGVGSPSGLQHGDTVYVFDTTYTAKTGSVSAATDFLLWDRSDPATNVRETMGGLEGLVRTINDYTTEVNARYVSAENEAPGKVSVEEKDLGDPAFVFRSSRPSAWVPQPATGSGGDDVWSDGNRHPARLYYSKLGQPEAVPPTNHVQVGSDNYPILRIKALNYRLYVFKTDGIYYVTDQEPFQVHKISEARLRSPESVSVLGERLRALTDQGLVIISDGQVIGFGGEVEEAIRDREGSSLAPLRSNTFAIAHETERHWLLWLPPVGPSGSTAFSGSSASESLVWSDVSRGFTRWDLGARCGGVEPSSDRLWLAPVSGNWLVAERKTMTDDDFRDEDLTVYVSSASFDSDSDTTELAVVASSASAGDLLNTQGDNYYLVVATSGSTVTVLGDPDFPAHGLPGTYGFLKAIDCRLEFNPASLGSPSAAKEHRQASLLWGDNSLRGVDVTFRSEASPLSSSVSLPSVGWGDQAFGEWPYGDQGQPGVVRVEPIPLDKSHAAQLSVGIRVRQARGGWRFYGLTVDASVDSDSSKGR